MTCDACTIHLEEALRELPGIRAVEVSFDELVARVSFESEDSG